MPLQDLAVGLGSKKQKKEPLSISWFDKFKKNADSSGGNSSAYKNPEGSDTKDSDSVTVPLPSVMFDDDTPDIYDGPEFTFTPEIYTAAQQSANRAAIYYTPDEALQEAYEADMAGKGNDEPDQTGGFGVPGVTVKDVTGTDAGALSNPQPLYDMADEFANPSITTTPLDQEAALRDALMQGQPTGLMSRPSSFVGEGVQVASLLDGAKTPAEIETILGNLFPEEEVVDVSPVEEAPDQVAPTPKVAPVVSPKVVVRDNPKVFGYVGRKGPTKKQSTAFNSLIDAATAKGIEGDELRQLLGQAAVESQWYTKAVEGGGGSASKISGGKKYLGRGPLQLTHDYNYRAFGEAKGVGDLYVKNPEKLADPKLGAEAALWFWETNVQPNVTDFTDTYAVSGLINRGSANKKALHLNERKQAFQAIRLRGVSPRPMLRP